MNTPQKFNIDTPNTATFKAEITKIPNHHLGALQPFPQAFLAHTGELWSREPHVLEGGNCCIFFVEKKDCQLINRNDPKY